MAASLQRPLVLPQWTNNPFIDSCLNLFTMATFFPKVAIVERFNCVNVALYIVFFLDNGDKP